MIPLLATGAAVMAIMMAALWILAVRLNNAGLVDTGRSAGLVILAGMYCANAPGFPWRRLLLFGLVLTWGTRVVVHLVSRMIREQKEDSRTQRIRESRETNVNLRSLLMFQFHGILDVALSVPFLLICLNPARGFGMVEYAGVALWVCGFLGEAVADEQLRRSKADPANQGRTCQAGLWDHSRSPSYFFECLMWAGYFVFALGSPWGWVSFYCPLLMLYFLFKVRGIPLVKAQALRPQGM